MWGARLFNARRMPLCRFSSASQRKGGLVTGRHAWQATSAAAQRVAIPDDPPSSLPSPPVVVFNTHQSLSGGSVTDNLVDIGKCKSVVSQNDLLRRSPIKELIKHRIQGHAGTTHARDACLIQQHRYCVNQTLGGHRLIVAVTDKPFNRAAIGPLRLLRRHPVVVVQQRVKQHVELALVLPAIARVGGKQ